MTEQELRDALGRALEARDPAAAREALAGLAPLGLNPRVVADNRLLDLTEETRNWWMEEARAHRLDSGWLPITAASVEEAVEGINEGARRGA